MWQVLHTVELVGDRLKAFQQHKSLRRWLAYPLEPQGIPGFLSHLMRTWGRGCDWNTVLRPFATRVCLEP